MDRLNQLRGDVGASRDSTLDTSSLPGEAYITANDSSKYFSLSEVDSSSNVSLSKEAVDNVTANSSLSDSGRIISNLSPIPKKSELNSFKIGEQIEAANILSGGVNIFEDNENSYDGDELVIDDEAAEGDDKLAELKLSENAEDTYEKTDRSANTNMEDVEPVIPSKDTEVVLQIDGKNVDAIDIGNGLYLYRKDGEEELAAVQILDDNQQQPDIKFLKVRENAEGNLEVYEEIEIEVPKEVPTKEGKAVKNTSHIPVKDMNKDSESVSNEVTDNKSQVVPKDAVSEVEIDLNKDNAHMETRTEVNLNGKMMKFSESRKSPLIGTFTPMTYHSTPNKEGIPLTKTMVDLQLHPNRHSENVKKTIEVHTDNCKQKLLETPTKSSKDSNDLNKSSECVSSLDKSVINLIATDGVDQIRQESNKDINKPVIENKSGEITAVKINDDNYEDNKLKYQQITQFDKNIHDCNIKKDKAVSDVNISTLVLKEPSIPVDTRCELNIDTCNEEGNVKISQRKPLLNEVCCEINSDICDEVKDNLLVNNAVEIHSESIESKDIHINYGSTKGNGNIATEKNMTNTNVSNSKNIVHNTETDGDVFSKKQDVANVLPLTNFKSHVDKSENTLNEMPSNSNSSTEISKCSKLSQNDIKIIDYSSVRQHAKDTVNAGNISPKSNKLSAKKEIKQINIPSETSDSTTKSVNLLNIVDPQNQPAQILKSQTVDGNINMNAQSELITSQKGMELLGTIKPFKEEGAIIPTNLKSETVSVRSEASVDILHNLSKEEKPKSVLELKQVKDEFKMKSSEVKVIKNDSHLKPLKHQNEGSDIVHPFAEPLNNTTEVKMIGNETKKKPDKLSKGLVKKVDAEFNQPENVSSKVVTSAAKFASSTELKSTHKDLVTIEQNSTRNSIPILKISTTDKAEIQKKNESNQKFPVLSKNTKASSLTSDLKKSHPMQNTPNEVERCKNDAKKEPTKVHKVSIPKPINNNKAAVPFGKWTEANRQEFLNKIKESKVPINTTNTKQLKQPNDLNRRDVLQKIYSQRQSSIASTKVQDLNILNKVKLKQETPTFVSKSNVTQKEKTKDNKVTPSGSKPEETVSTNVIENKNALVKKSDKEQPSQAIPMDMSSMPLSTKKDPVHRKEINNQDLIDKTIEGIINRAVTTKLSSDDLKQDIESAEKPQNATLPYTPVSLDEIESKMNELHGIPFVERPPHELPQVFEHENKSIVIPDKLTASKSSKMPSTFNKPPQKNDHDVNESFITRVNEESDEEIIEHEPVTGDIELNKNDVIIHGIVKDKIQPQETIATKVNCDTKKESIITENDFDKFARRTSITYENCLTVSFDGKEHHNVVHTVVERETVPKKLSRNEIMLAESRAKSHKQLAMRQVNISSKIPITTKITHDEDSYNKNYQSKVQMAYQSVMTAKRQQEGPITIIEDKPVKVVFMDANHEYIPHQLNVQGKELSPPKKSVIEWDHFTHSNSESLDSDILDASNDSKSQDDVKFKSKHQRKQVLTPVEAPELELIEPGDLGIEVSPKKKRKTEDNKPEKSAKSLVPKKSYLLNRNITKDTVPSNSNEPSKTPLKESVNQQDVFVKHQDPISAIDNLVKAAELLETQSENQHVLPLTDQNSPSQQSSPVKRGRGRPRKYPLAEQGSEKSPSPAKTPTPQKKPRLIDAKIPKHDTESEEEMNSDGELVKENWTMGKINENIVCPICNKLFRSENVVFKHVKHCTGPSPSRSDSDKRSPRRMRQSQELDWKSEGSKSDSMDLDEDYEINKPMKKRKSKEKRSSIDVKPDDKTEVIVIEDTPIKDRDSAIRKRERLKHDPNKTMVKANAQHVPSNLMCEFCGKTFRQLSYLVNHKLQHKNIETKKIEKDLHKSLFNCEICKKEFRKLHHLVQHRIIHNPNPTRPSRKSSLEQSDNSKSGKDVSRVTEDQSAGFRCEPCDKSFRKLHHLVEHRETHDEINKRCNPVASSTVDTTKPTPLHHCDICKKTFKKLQHLIEHKEHHLDTSSEKSDDKSVKSSLSTKDIIHECPLCYMVFPNEHSLNKHHIICQRKKKQSAAKQAKQIDEKDVTEDDETKVMESGDENTAILEQKAETDTSCVIIEDEIPTVPEIQEPNIIEIAKPLELEQKKEEVLINDIKVAEVDLPLEPNMDKNIQMNEKRTKLINKKDTYEHNTDKASVKPKKYAVSTIAPVEIIKIIDTPTPKKKLLAKHKFGATITKRQKTTGVPLPVVEDGKAPDSSDDDEIRYMLNPNFQPDKSNEGKLFMKVRATKRNSLQIERPNSKDLMKRRISLQHPPKIPRLKVKPIPRKSINTNTVVKSSRATTVPTEPQLSTDSDDSDVKYSFPEPVKKEMEKEAQKKVKKQKIVEKRKSLGTIAKRKSLGKMISVKQKMKPSPAKQIKKRTADAEHRCDCGQLFSSAALLMRHTSLAHTPPRIRRRRSPPPDNDVKPNLKRTEKPQENRRIHDPAPKKPGVTTRKSSINSEVKATGDVRKTPKSASLLKTRRSAPHKPVSVPEKMRKLMDKSKK